ncbi:MAG TPA: acetyl-CoA carboxylase carboxyltransferase subunit alpha [candidate division Zixibacteria bacterium]|nr:acetyl-CoA carboxylase carboxyltransferase subunit alpha [candidate division Zixibacteria bacterium]MDD4916771.1 acetyl-CoA carboxylase carboxyltransferase subunit alpha [candidate division Zixibacteria bacterium]MDM7973908.1 acetyl-CoA carboxylase carboxyltransferase subunit alpha [candidate division Zixibacteria bacterium]HOD66110.1 acetyl-CoA carboxylase carboxyltransferase subunit alpha [candidate division Zixibacteria bacterium]HOZ06838.1 acetyl-CoA carboxylase carboxyltransferase subun
MPEGPILDFERPIRELEKKISGMKDFSIGESIELSGEIALLERKLERLREEVYSNLNRWQMVQLSRHPKRPYTLDYIRLMTTGFIELHGDRRFADDPAMVGGLAWLDDQPVMIVGQQKGRDTKEKVRRNFGMAHPEGYRKALRLFRLAEKFDVPIVILIDTPGAFPGIGAEERGQAEAIAYNIREMFGLRVPIVIVIIGEGASGGALGIGVGDVVMMLQFSWYSVISPEGCAAILWRDAAKAPEAAEALRPTASDLMALKIVDKVIPEPSGGAHSDPEGAAAAVRAEIQGALADLKALPVDRLLERRLAKYRVIGEFDE